MKSFIKKRFKSFSLSSLNENGEITVRLAVGHMDTGTHSLTCTLKIPFDVYINKIYNKANTECTVKCDYKETKDGYDIYEGNIKDIYVPVWVEEKEYEIISKVNYVYTSADGKASDPINSNATANVTVVGALYDFTIIFKEMFYEYEYSGNKYCNGAKINVKTSSIADIECVDWGLKQFFKKACHYIYHNTNDLPKLLDCLRDKSTGELL